MFWYGAISPYMLDRYTSLVRSSSLPVEFWFVRETSPERSWLIDGESVRTLPHRFVRSFRGIGLPPRMLLGRRAPRAIITFHGARDVSLASVFGQRRDVHLAYYVEKTFDSCVRRDEAKERMKRLLIGRAQSVLVPGPDGEAYARGYGAESVHLLRHATDYSKYASAAASRRLPETVRLRAELGLAGFVWLYVGRITRLKGLDVLIRAFHELVRSSRRPSTLLVVGDGDEKAGFETLCAERQLPVVFVPFVQQSSLPEYFALADAFVFPSLGDTYALVVDEAQASGLPVVVSNANGIGEIETRVSNGVDGLLVPPGDVAALAQAMSAVLSMTYEEREVMGDRALHRAATRTTDRWVRDLEMWAEKEKLLS